MANVSNNATCLSENGLTSVRRILISPMAVPSRSKRRRQEMFEYPPACASCPGISLPPPEGPECGLSCAGAKLHCRPSATASFPAPVGRQVVSFRNAPPGYLIAIEQANRRVVGPAHPSRALGNRIKHRLDVRRRAGDDAQNFARRGLLLQRLLELLEQPNVLEGDDRLVREGFRA